MAELLFLEGKFRWHDGGSPLADRKWVNGMKPGVCVTRRNRMANNKISDSVDETAFQALEDALQLGAFEEKPETRKTAKPKQPEARVKEASRQTPAPEAARAPTEQTPRSPNLEAANDGSKRSPAMILKSLEGGSIGGALRNATIMSVIWALGGLGIAHLLYGNALWSIGSLADLTAIPGLMAIVVGILVPVMLFFAFAIMMARARDLRNAARSMAEVALRLAEPETVASDRIMSVGQAVRREVSAMNDGIERTIARATELETLVHSEVNALERSYADNELRVRSLVQELTAERDAIVNHAERIRSSIVGAQEQIKEELSIVGEELSMRIATTGEAFASMIDTRSAALLEKSRASTEAMGSLIAAKTENLLQALNSSGSTISNEFDMRLHNLTSTLDERGEVLLERFAIHASTLDSGVESLNSALEERTRQLNETLSTRSLELNRNIERGQQVIGGSLDTVLDKLSTTLEEKGLSFRQSLQSTADDAIMDLDLRSGLYEERMQATVGQVNSAFDEHVAQFASAFDQRAGEPRQQADGKPRPHQRNRCRMAPKPSTPC